METEHCQDCGVLVGTPRGMAEYHPHEFCRVFKAGGNPWGNVSERLNLQEVDDVIKEMLQENCRRFWREKYRTEVTLP